MMLQNDNRRLEMMVQSMQTKENKANQTIKTLQDQLQEKSEECVGHYNDKIKFKELSEGYMKDIARLEAQLESVDVKPRSKLSQRPKDTVPRDQTHSLSNIHPGRVKTVEKNKLFATCMHLKLLLQHRHITMDNIHKLIFNDLDLNEQVSIAELRDGFIDLGIPVSKALLMARYLIEPPTQGEVMFNEQAMSTQGEIVRELREIIGHYRLFKAEGYDIEDDTNYVAEEYMKKVVFETYGKKKEAFQESLHSEAV